MHHKFSLLIAAAFALVVNAQAQTFAVKGNMKGAFSDTLQLHFAPIAAGQQADAPLTTKGRNFEGATAPAADGFYQFYGINGQLPLQLPVYVAPQAKMPKFALSLVDNCLQTAGDRNNQALSAFNLIAWQRLRNLWDARASLNTARLKSHLLTYPASADSLIARYRVDAPVTQYLRIWANFTAYTAFNMSGQVLRKEAGNEKLRFADLYTSDLSQFDSPLTSYFPGAAQCIASAMPYQSQTEQMMASVASTFSNNQVRQLLYRYIMERFVANFDYDKQFDEGLRRVEALTATYGLPDTYLNTFRSRQVAATGQPFPAGVRLTDAQGNAVDFASLRGYYVYVDLWASWCVPCLREAPFLQQLEKELQNPLVKIVSISIDRTEEPWKKKMEQLGMHGLQWINTDNSLPEALNVRGIPYFVIYDKNGNMLLKDAPRPSNPQLKPYLESLK